MEEGRVLCVGETDVVLSGQSRGCVVGWGGGGETGSQL